MARIRQKVFQVTQATFAEVAGVSQGTVSKWEAGEFEPTREQLQSIRQEAKRRNIDWRDEWFFERTCGAPAE